MNNIALITRKVKEKGINNDSTIENLMDATINYSKLNQSYNYGKEKVN